MHNELTTAEVFKICLFFAILSGIAILLYIRKLKPNAHLFETKNRNATQKEINNLINKVFFDCESEEPGFGHNEVIRYKRTVKKWGPDNEDYEGSGID